MFWLAYDFTADLIPRTTDAKLRFCGPNLFPSSPLRRRDAFECVSVIEYVPIIRCISFSIFMRRTRCVWRMRRTRCVWRMRRTRCCCLRRIRCCNWRRIRCCNWRRIRCVSTGFVNENNQVDMIGHYHENRYFSFVFAYFCGFFYLRYRIPSYFSVFHFHVRYLSKKMFHFLRANGNEICSSVVIMKRGSGRRYAIFLLKFIGHSSIYYG